jgi:dephospho-CoA kinase
VLHVGLTGNIGSGKSTVATLFARWGAVLIDADELVHQLQHPGTAVFAGIVRRFGADVLRPDGTLDRTALRRRVLASPADLAALNQIVHPAVREWRDAFIEQNRASPALVFEIPLLFETRSEKDFDKVVVVSAPAEVQRARVLARGGMTLDRFNSILARQMPDEEKRRRADFVIDTGADLSTTEAQVRDILACLGVAPA